MPDRYAGEWDHEPEDFIPADDPLWQIAADGQAWIDSDDRDSWPYEEAVSLAAMLEGMGYAVELFEV